jgi:hypothetical protein
MATQTTSTWPELAVALYDGLTGRGAEITYEFDDMRVEIPGSAEREAPRASWRVDGTLRIRTRDQKPGR